MIGTDIEYFLVSPEGQVVSSEGFVPGEKGNELVIRGFKVSPDNVMAEIATPPAKTEEEFLSFVREGEEILEAVSGHQILAIPSHRFHPKDVQSPHAKIFGCSPDNLAWTKGVEERKINPVELGEPFLRTCGGHIHFSYNDPNEIHTLQVIRWMDVHIGLPSLFLDKDQERMKLYGALGCFRFKPYGGEYRTPSNFWTTSDSLVRWIYQSTELSIQKALNDEVVPVQVGNKMVEVYKERNLTEASKIMEQFNVALPETILSHV